MLMEALLARLRADGVFGEIDISKIELPTRPSNHLLAY